MREISFGPFSGARQSDSFLAVMDIFEMRGLWDHRVCIIPRSVGLADWEVIGVLRSNSVTYWSVHSDR